MAKDKVSRKELLKKDDAFINAASLGVKWLAANRTQVVVGCVLVVAVILGTWGLVEHLRTRDQKASVLFNRGLTILEGQVMPSGAEEQPQPDAEKPSFASDTDKWKAARGQFEKVAKETGGSRVAMLAAFFVADLTQRLGEKDEAEKQFQALVRNLSPSDSLFFLAVERAADLEAARGDRDAALGTLGRLVNVDKGFYADFATLGEARLYVEKGDTERARNLLKRIERDFPKSPVMEDVRVALSSLPPAPAEPAPAMAPAPTLEPVPKAPGQATPPPAPVGSRVSP